MPTILSTATQMGTGAWKRSYAPRKNFMTSEMFEFGLCFSSGGAKLMEVPLVSTPSGSQGSPERRLTRRKRPRS